MFVSWPGYAEEEGEGGKWRQRVLETLGRLLLHEGQWRISVPETMFVDMFSGRVWGRLGPDLVTGFELMEGDYGGKSAPAAAM